MSEQNILNPTSTSLFSPDWGYTEGLPEMRTQFQAASGRIYSRRQMGRGRIYDLAWNNRDLPTKHTLQQWAQQYENDFFSLSDWERARYFTGRFDGPLTFNPVGNQRYNIKGRFVELPGLAMFSYPTNWSRDAIFFDSRNGFGDDLVKPTGTWAYGSSSFTRSGFAYASSTTNDIAEWIYFGYGFQLWDGKGPALGIVEMTLTRVRDGAIISGPTNVDLYNSTNINDAALLTVSATGLDFYRVKLRVTGTKNASSSGFSVLADAIQVMQ